MDCLTKGKFLGATVHNYEVDGNLFSVTNYEEGTTSDWHYHESSFLTFILCGGSVEFRPGEAHSCNPGDALFYSGGIIHKNIAYQKSSKNFNLEINESWLKENGISQQTFSNHFVLSPPEVKFLIIKLYQEFSLQDHTTSFSINTLLLKLFSDPGIHHSGKSLPQWAEKVKEVLNDEWTQNFSLKELSARVGAHPVTISKHFPKYFNCTLGDYIRKLRVNKALQFIKSTNYSLTEIAYTCGFADQSHFIRCFKKFTGVLPNYYRKM